MCQAGCQDLMRCKNYEVNVWIGQENVGEVRRVSYTSGNP